MNGDLITQFDVARMLDHHASGGHAITVGVHDYRVDIPYGVISTQPSSGHVERIDEKPSFHYTVNGGVYVVARHLFDRFPMPGRFSFERDLIEPNVGRIRPLAYQSDAYFIDMGVPEDYRRAQHEMAREP